jgi:hypothetical protein
MCSTAVAWALFALACHPKVQDKLRDELLDFPNDEPSMEDLNALPYLDSCLREVLRLYAPVPAAARVVEEDAIIPLDTPIVDKNGVTLSEIQYVGISSILHNMTHKILPVLRKEISSLSPFE